MNYFSYWTAAGENELENFLSAHYKQLKTNKRNERKFLGISLFILYLFFFRSVIQFHITRLLYILPHSWIRVFGKIYNQRIKIHFNKCTKRNAKLFLCESHIHWMKLQKKKWIIHTHIHNKRERAEKLELKSTDPTTHSNIRYSMLLLGVCCSINRSIIKLDRFEIVNKSQYEERLSMVHGVLC